MSFHYLLTTEMNEQLWKRCERRNTVGLVEKAAIERVSLPPREASSKVAGRRSFANWRASRAAHHSATAKQ
jgi:hypothetical protein